MCEWYDLLIGYPGRKRNFTIRSLSPTKLDVPLEPPISKAYIMISHSYRCIFVEIPKTGSTSIKALIGHPPKSHLNICQIQYNMMHNWTHYGGRKNRILASLYLLLPEKKRNEIGIKQFETYFKFGFVRNPWDRVVSLYLRKQGLQMSEKMSFDEFVQWIQYSSSTCIHPVPHVNQLDWLVDPHGNVLVDFIGRFERLNDDWNIISEKLKIRKDLPHKNSNPRQKHYTEYYTRKTRTVIEGKFKRDIEFFEYEFGG